MPHALHLVGPALTAQPTGPQQAASGLTLLHKIVAVQNGHDLMGPQSHGLQALTSA